MVAVAINSLAYNFIKIHRSLRMSPAMAAGVVNWLMDVNDLRQPADRGRIDRSGLSSAGIARHG